MTAAATIAAPDMADLRTALAGRAIVLVGMMGSGKSSVGRRLAHSGRGGTHPSALVLSQDSGSPCTAAIARASSSTAR